jgi:hypothetical protein
MTEFKVGDFVLYTPNIKGLLNAKDRIRDHGIVIDILWGTHCKIKLYNAYTIHTIGYPALTLLDNELIPKNMNLNKISNIQLEITTKIIPIGSYDPITFYEFKNNDIIVDFLRNDTEYESNYNMYYSEESFNQLDKNPITLKKIDKISSIKYIVKIQN